MVMPGGILSMILFERNGIPRGIIDTSSSDPV